MEAIEISEEFKLATEAAKEMEKIMNLDFGAETEKTRSALKEGLKELVENTKNQEKELEVMDLDLGESGHAVSCYMDGVHIGDIDISKDGKTTVIPEKNAELLLANDEKEKENDVKAIMELEGVSENDAREQAEELNKELKPTKEEALKTKTRLNPKEVKEVALQTGIGEVRAEEVTAIYDNLLKQAEKAEKNAKENVLNSKKDAITGTWDKTKEELNELENKVQELSRQMAIALMQEPSGEKQNKAIQNFANEIVEKSKKAAEKRAELAGLQKEYKECKKELFLVKTGLDKKIELGHRTISRMTDIIKEANAKFIAGREVSYTKSYIKQEQQYKNYLLKSYSLEKTNKENLEKAYHKLERKFEHNLEVKAAAKGLLNAIRGKDRKEETMVLNQRQLAKLQALQAEIQECESNMSEMKRDFAETSRNMEIEIRETREMAKEAKLAPDKYLEDKLKDLREKNIDKVLDATKEAKAVDKGEPDMSRD